jgi:hypothetical protein
MLQPTALSSDPFISPSSAVLHFLILRHASLSSYHGYFEDKSPLILLGHRGFSLQIVNFHATGIISLALQAVLADFPSSAPDCLRCGQRTSKRTTKSSNRNGNAGCPYYTCSGCGKFSTFADTRGNDISNPVCYCNSTAKRQRSGARKGKKVHYVCRLGTCTFFDWHRTSQTEVLSLEDNVLDHLARLSLI